jgi:hypothetical protein
MRFFGGVLALLIGVSAMAQAPAAQAPPDKQRQVRQVLENFGQSVLTLEENRGQAPKGVDYVALGLGHKFLLSSTGPTLQLFDAGSKSSHSVQLKLVGASPSSSLGGNLSDAGLGIVVDNSGNAYVVGRTNSSNFPLRDPWPT